MGAFANPARHRQHGRARRSTIVNFGQFSTMNIVTMEIRGRRRAPLLLLLLMRKLLLKLLILQHTRVSFNRGNGGRMLLLPRLLMMMILANEMLDAQLFRRRDGASGRPTSLLLLLLLLKLIFVGSRERAASRSPLRRSHVLVFTRDGAAIRRKGAFVVVFASGAVAVDVDEHVVADV